MDGYRDDTTHSLRAACGTLTVITHSTYTLSVDVPLCHIEAKGQSGDTIVPLEHRIHGYL